ncbi:FecR family protein [Mucilaginibacter oryzae]|uniref:FecR family protein n=1 Tax=Mucilaginibacter oryzae TaxID=468058 RepID=A0A316HER5_9SPHI|nr:FecR domain-containing protein [Mucilaginibacter oryzae]PWK79078.1 FecR family protein [Mucilaginibacter oryzae]
MTYNKAYFQELIIEQVAGTISEEESHLLTDAIQNDSRVKQLWDEMQHTLSSDQAQSFFNAIDENKAWNKVSPQITSPLPKASRRLPIAKWLSMAALLCVAFTAGYYWRSVPVKNTVIAKNNIKAPAIELRMANGQHIDLSDTNKKTVSVPFANLTKGANGLSYQLNNAKTDEWSTLVIPSKLNYRIVLSDGTKVWLNSLSSLRFPFAFSGKTRDVYLTGEAFFKVAKNASMPFIVHTSQTDVKVLGTEFNVNTYQLDKTITSLVEGSVSTSGRHKQKTLLQPGYQAIYTDAAGFDTQPFDPTVELAWMKDIYYFHNTRLHEISDVLLRWFDVDVVFDNPAKADEAFSGAIEKNKPVDVFIQNIKASAGVDAVLKNGVLHIR